MTRTIAPGIAARRIRLVSAAFALVVAGCGAGDDGPPAPGLGDDRPAASAEAAEDTLAAAHPERPGAGESAGASTVEVVHSHVDRPAGATAEAAAPHGAPSLSEIAPDSTAARPAPPPEPVRLPSEGARPAFERPEHVRGIYLNAWTAGSSRRIRQLIDLARRTEINSFVIDIKDATGYVSHASGVETAREAGAVGEIRIRDLPGLLRTLEEEGIYPIARIVVVKDPLMVAAQPGWAIQDTAGGVWVDGKGIRWLNAFDERVWEYHIDLAEEVVRLGFPEIQWDYVRFPDAPRSDLARATFPEREGRTRSEAIRSFLQRSRDELAEFGTVVTADVFGVTTSATGDVGIGQVWEDFIDVVDVALPMVYPSHYWSGSFGIERPNARPYEVIRHALTRALERSAAVEGAGSVRPWLQDFDLGEPEYGSPEVRAQIQATYDVGIGEWVLWNPSSRYTEEALAPAEGWPEGSEPIIRVAGLLVPVSQRDEVLELAEALGEGVPPVPPRLAPEEGSSESPDPAGAAADTLPPRARPAPRSPRPRSTTGSHESGSRRPGGAMTDPERQDQVGDSKLEKDPDDWTRGTSG